MPQLFAAGHVHRVQQHRQRAPLPYCDADDQRQFGHTTDTLLGGLAFQHPSQTSFGSPQHAVVAEHRFQCHVACREQLRHAGWMCMRHIKLGAELVDVLQWRRSQRGTILIMPCLELVKHGLRTHVFDHFPTALR